MTVSGRLARGCLFVAAAAVLVLASACSGLSQAQPPSTTGPVRASPFTTTPSQANPSGATFPTVAAGIAEATVETSLAVLPQTGATAAAPGNQANAAEAAVRIPSITPPVSSGPRQGSAPPGAAGAGPAPVQVSPAAPATAGAAGQAAISPVALAQATPAAGSQADGPQASLPGVQYVSPLPGSAFNPAGATIALRYGSTLDANDVHAGFTVTGTSSGSHDGSVILSDDQKTLIFKPNQPFAPGETVQIAVSAWKEAAGGDHPALSFQFQVATDVAKPASTTGGEIVPQDSAPLPDGYVPVGPQGPYVTLPLDFPAITVTVPATNTAPGDIFASNFQLYPGPSGYYLMILDNNGEPVYYQKLAANTRVLDFKPLPDGTLSYADDARNAFVIMDNTYHEIRTLQPGNGYQWFDEHDLQLLPDGHYLLMANEVRTMDLSKVTPGGNPQAQVTAQVLQELDRSMNVVFQWRVLDNVPIQDTTESLISNTIDFSHANAIALDNDGNILLSMRHLDEVVKIDRNTGAVMWRLGGTENQFIFSLAAGVSGPVNFYHQHDIRVLPDGHITLFDNHNDHAPQVSRALEYALDEKAKTATLVWAWEATPTPYAIAMGNVQRLDNGDTLIDWGTNLFPQIDEVAPDGTKVFELDFGGSDVSYRAFRAPWHGYPTWSPALVGQAEGSDLKLTFSWNGATDVSSYRVLSGNSNPPTDVVGQQQKSGFETSYTIKNAQQAACFYEVVPIDSGGKDGLPSGVLTNPARSDCGQGH